MTKGRPQRRAPGWAVSCSPASASSLGRKGASAGRVAEIRLGGGLAGSPRCGALHRRARAIRQRCDCALHSYNDSFTRPRPGPQTAASTAGAWGGARPSSTSCAGLLTRESLGGSPPPLRQQASYGPAAVSHVQDSSRLRACLRTEHERAPPASAGCLPRSPVPSPPSAARWVLEMAPGRRIGIRCPPAVLLQGIRLRCGMGLPDDSHPAAGTECDGVWQHLREKRGAAPRYAGPPGGDATG